jgi:cation diffusion facilitator CzcD-associated flavoprotein CzcO
MAPSIIIIGTGFAGICAAIRLKQEGITSFTILERSGDVGGTWRDNTYPGAACDVASHLYSFSFEPNPGWSNMFSGQKEIHEYIKHCIAKYDIGKYIRFNRNVSSSVFNEATGEWQVSTTNGEVHRANVLINGMGPLNRPSLPGIEGLKDFEGIMFHSSEWDHSYDISNKRVAVIGTGASAIQIVPAIVDKVAHLDLYQRTAPWIIPKHDKPISGKTHKLFRALPFLQKLQRAQFYLINEFTVLMLVTRPSLAKYLEKLVLKYIAYKVSDPVLRKKVTPGFTIGCKRILLSNNYYPALGKPNVEVITDPILRIEKDAIITANEKRPVDAIILSTGFEASEYPKGFVVKGLQGRLLEEDWKDGPEAYLGTVVAGFPNLFFIIGPNTGLGHTSMIYMIESQVNFIVDSIKKLSAKKATWMNVKKDVQISYNAELQQKLKTTVWQSGGCKSWYQTRSGKNTAIWPGFTFTFRNRTKRVNEQDFDWKS